MRSAVVEAERRTMRQTHPRVAGEKVAPAQRPDAYPKRQTQAVNLSV